MCFKTRCGSCINYCTVAKYTLNVAVANNYCLIEEKMKLVTFNMGVNLPQAQLADRLDALGRLIQSRRPEFLALQNVTNETIKRISISTWGSRYNLIQPPNKYETRNKPTIALFTVYPAQDTVTISYHESLSSKMLQKGYFVMYDKQKKPFVICVATTILEPGNENVEYREKQLNEGFLSMVHDEDAFLIGTFSLDSKIDGEVNLQGGWVDAWLQIPGNTESTGYTYNPERNPLLMEDFSNPSRPDRIFFKTRQFKLESVELLGVEPYQLPQGVGINISTHYGLLAQFSQLDVPKPKVEPVIVSAYFTKKKETS